MVDTGITQDLRVAHLLADAARKAINPYFRTSSFSLENKAANGADASPQRDRFDPVTAADRASEEAMRLVLARERPEDAILGEEFGAVDGNSGRQWILDPIDGTRSFMSGLTSWGVLVALHDGQRPILGVLDQPYLRERYVGVIGGDAARAELVRAGDERTGRGPTPLATRACEDLAQATLFSTDPDLFAAGAEKNAFDALKARVRVRRYGADCYGYAMVAAGFADLVVEAGLAPYDVQAPIALIEAAGGVASDWSGARAPWSGRIVAAGDPRVHAAALEILSQAA